MTPSLFLYLAHYKVPQSIQGKQEATSAASGNGQIFALPNPGWHPLPTRQLGPPQRPCKKSDDRKREDVSRLRRKNWIDEKSWIDDNGWYVKFSQHVWTNYSSGLTGLCHFLSLCYKGVVSLFTKYYKILPPKFSIYVRVLFNLRIPLVCWYLNRDPACITMRTCV